MYFLSSNPNQQPNKQHGKNRATPGIETTQWRGSPILTTSHGQRLKRDRYYCRDKNNNTDLALGGVQQKYYGEKTSYT